MSESVQETKGEQGKNTKDITILVNNKPVVLHDDRVTGAQIEQAAGLPASFKLYDPDGHQVQPDERVKIKDHEKFTAISGQDVS